MSEENVELLRRSNEAFNAHDLETWATFYDPAFTFIDHTGAVAEKSGSGFETIRRQAEGWLDIFPDFQAEVLEFIDAGDRVITVTHWQGTGTGSGLAFSQPQAEITTIRDGKIVRLEMGFENKKAALEAAGLSE
ncbi:MAG: nuclear transport factor 2 family protein [Solirubrobacterales bacterium]